MKVINRKPDGVPDGATYIGRPTIYGNPFKIGPDGTREQVVKKFEVYFYERLKHDNRFRVAVKKLETAEALCCWCAPLPCHGDVIARYIEAVLTEPKE
jgi:hypothetical protein